MAMKSDIRFVQAIDTGVMDLQAMRDNFDNIEEVVDEHATEIETLASRQTQTISFGIDEDGLTTILQSDKHHRIEIVNAFVQMGDNRTDECIVELVGITDAVKFSSTEKSGKVRLFNIIKKNLLFHEEIIVKTNSDRRIIVNVTCVSSEGDN